jgi:integrase
MSLGKQAKILTDAQQQAVLAYLRGRRNGERDTIMFLLSVDAGLRAKEIASVTWEMITDAEGNLTDEIRLENKATKGESGGVVYMSKRLDEELAQFAVWQQEFQRRGTTGTIIKAEKSGKQMSAQVVVNWFYTLYKRLGYEGCSSHSGRRTAITRWSRKISSVGGSMRDVQALARHSSLQMTQSYIETSADAMKKVVG